MPVEAGVPDQLLVMPGAEQHPVLAGSEEAGEEGSVALFVDVLDLVEALVGSDHRQQRLQLLRRDRLDSNRRLHGKSR